MQNEPTESPLRSDLLNHFKPPFAILGYGVEGRATQRFIEQLGLPSYIFDHYLDQATPVRVYKPDDPLLFECATIIKAPGIRPDAKPLPQAQAKGIVLASALEVFLRLCRAKVVGITGTLGKGTVASMLYAALTAAGHKAWLGGNIGLNPLEFLDEINPSDTVILELSSFQLMVLPPDCPRPSLAVLLRTTEEHLDWHSDRQEYISAKSNLLERNLPKRNLCAREEQIVISHAENEPKLSSAIQFSRTAPVTNGIGVEAGRPLWHSAESISAEGIIELPQLLSLPLTGVFQLENAAAALLAAHYVGADYQRALSGLQSFKPLPYRLQLVGTIGGRIECYNDSYSTRPLATIGALNSFSKPLALIMGGKHKNTNFTDLLQTIYQHRSLQAVVLIGEAAEHLQEALQNIFLTAEPAIGKPSKTVRYPSVIRASSLKEAFKLALASLPDAGVLLFSPACASFDMFKDYKHRGECFNQLVRAAEG